MSFISRFYFYEKTLSGLFDAEPHEYRLKTEEYPTPENIQDVIFQAIEIELMESEFFLELIVENDGKYVNSDECIVYPEVYRTSEPSSFVRWGNKKPHIFSVDRGKSKLSFHTEKV